MAFVRVTDTELAKTLRDNGLLYEQAYDYMVPTPIEWGRSSGDWHSILRSSWQFYMQLEDQVCSV